MTRDFSPGDTVVIKSGTYSGHTGKVARIDPVSRYGFAIVQVGREPALSYRFDELEPSPSTAGIGAAYRQATNP